MRIVVYDRSEKIFFQERVYGLAWIKILYGKRRLFKALSFFLLPLVAYFPFLSKCYALIQKTKWSRKKIAPFIKAFKVDSLEFKEPLTTFKSFNHFFIRTLKPTARPIAPGDDTAILPADGRYLVFPALDQSEQFYVKGQTFDLAKLLCNDALAKKYRKGALVIGRLCPSDCHRFLFPCDCIPSKTESIKGPLYSVNPMALRHRLEILLENERRITTLQTRSFGDLLFIEIGATFVGAIRQTYCPMTSYSKGEEKGYFEFGGSCLLLLFEPGRITFDADLIRLSTTCVETHAQMGQSLGRALSS